MWFSNQLRIAGQLCCRTALVLTLACTYVAQTRADPAAGEGVFAAKQCESCHAMSGPVAAVPVEERPGIKGPPLWFAGSKFQKEWLIAWLENPVPVRRVNYGTLDKVSDEHPALSAAEAADIGDYLSGLIDPETKSGVVVTTKLAVRKMFKGEKLFIKKQVCFGCHEYPSKQGDIGGFTGPTMVGAGERLQADWVYAFMKDPLHYYPNGRMPVYGEQAHEPYTDVELKLLAQYLTNL